MARLPRYVQERVSPKGDISYRFNPPQFLVDEEVVVREECGSDLKQVRQIVKVHNDAIDAYRAELAKVVQIKSSSRVTDLINLYYQSNDFNMLRTNTKVDYRYFLTVLHQSLGTRKYELVTSKMAKATYEEWVKRGVSFANHAATCASRVYNYAIKMEHTHQNPWSKIERYSVPQRKVVWKHEDVVRFLDYSYSDYEYRSIGLIVQMAYEWCQRLGDMRTLQWDNLDLGNRVLKLEQSKRRADVELPISEELTSMLYDQAKQFNFQPYVAPHPRSVMGEYQPYAMERLSKVGRRVMRLAKLPEELRLMDLRRTGVTQMIDKGVPMGQLMSVTGHNHVSSVKPYMKHTLDAASNALTQRNVRVQSSGNE